MQTYPIIRRENKLDTNSIILFVCKHNNMNIISNASISGVNVAENNNRCVTIKMKLNNTKYNNAIKLIELSMINNIIQYNIIQYNIMQ